jgi:glutamine synthetase
MVSKLEYIWLDGYKPTQNLRSKTQVVKDFDGQLESCPVWSFDGSSTKQADGSNSDCLLKPVAIYPDPCRVNSYLVMNEVYCSDGNPHKSNNRALIDDDDSDFWFGFEQEYFLWDNETDKPLGFTFSNGENRTYQLDGENNVSKEQPPQGQYYCSVGAQNTFGRELVEEHLNQCLEAGINVEGINAEVAPGQWEYQIFAKGAKDAGDQVWVARFLAERNAEADGLSINLHPKPIEGDWNGSGMHANFSNEVLRTCGDEKIFNKVCLGFARNIDRHMSVYGAHNEQRLTGKHETQSIDEFSYGVSDRGASIRIPIGTVQNKWKGRLEDRRPSSNGDPYAIASAIVKTTKESLKN